MTKKTATKPPKKTEEIIVTDDENSTSIRNEEDFRDAIIVANTRKKSSQKSERFAEIERQIHEYLAKQDSDSTLTIVTKGALSLGSSDIHYDQAENDIAIRVRIDGDLETICTLSRAEYKLVLERLKYRSDLKLNITDVPQDGKYRIASDGEKIDVRVSTLPVQYGENAVCRILDSTKNIPTIDELGFMWTSKRQIEHSLRKKNGTILVT